MDFLIKELLSDKPISLKMEKYYDEQGLIII